MSLTVTEMHGAVTHFPIAMIIAAAAFEIGSPLFKKPEWRVVSFWLLVVAVVGAIPSLITGWITGGQMFGASPVLPKVYTLHRLLAFVTSGLALLYLLWRIAAKDKIEGGALAGSIVLSLILLGLVSYTGYLGGAMAVGTSSSAPLQTSAPTAQNVATGAVAPTLDPKLVVQGKLLYSQQGCDGCHKVDGKGGSSGPDLSHEGGRNPNVDWQVSHLKDPAKMKPNSFMPAYAQLTPDQLKALAQYVVSLK